MMLYEVLASMSTFTRWNWFGKRNGWILTNVIHGMAHQRSIYSCKTFADVDKWYEGRIYELYQAIIVQMGNGGIANECMVYGTLEAKESANYRKGMIIRRGGN